MYILWLGVSDPPFFPLLFVLFLAPIFVSKSHFIWSANLGMASPQGGQRAAVAALALALLAAIAVAGLVASAHAAASRGAVLASTWSIASMLASQQPARAPGKQGPEIPDPHPDPDPWPYPGHPARSPAKGVLPRRAGLASQPPAKAAPAKTQQKTLRQDREGVVAAPQLGRMHGCKPEQISVMPTDDCDPLAAKMQPAIDAFDKRVQAAHADNFAGVHWTSGDVTPETDALPYFEKHGGYSGFGFNDIVYDTYHGVHPTMYKPTVGWEPHKFTMGTSHLKRKADHSLKEYQEDDKQIAMLIAEGNDDLVRSKTASPHRAVRLLRDATVDFKAAHAYKTRMETAPRAQKSAARDQASSAAAQKALQAALEPSSSKEEQAYVKGLKRDDTGGLLLNAVGAISSEARRLSNLADDLDAGNAHRMVRVSRETLDVKAALAALDSASSAMGNVHRFSTRTNDPVQSF